MKCLNRLMAVVGLFFLLGCSEPQTSSGQAPIQLTQAELNQKLTSAVEAQELAQVKAFLDQGADPNWHKEFDDALLFKAVKRGHLEIAEILIANKAKIDPSQRGRYTIPFWILHQYSALAEPVKFSEKIAVGVIPSGSGLSDQQRIERDIEVYKRFLDLGSDPMFVGSLSGSSYYKFSVFEAAIYADTVLAREGYVTGFTKALADRGFVLGDIREKDSPLGRAVREKNTSGLVKMVISNFAGMQNHLTSRESEGAVRARVKPIQNSALTDLQLAAFIQLLKILDNVGADFAGLNLLHPPLFSAIFDLSPDVFEAVFAELAELDWSFYGAQTERTGGTTPFTELARVGEQVCQLESKPDEFDIFGKLRRSLFGRQSGDCLHDMLDNAETYLQARFTHYSPGTARQIISSMVNFQPGDFEYSALNEALSNDRFNARFMELLMILGANLGPWQDGRFVLLAEDERVRRIARINELSNFEALREQGKLGWPVQEDLRRYRKKYDSNKPATFEPF
jgi:hypothetical protein